MHRKVIGAAMLALALAAGSAAVVGRPTVAYAEKALSAAVGKPLQEAQSLLKEKDARGALSKIQVAEGISGRTAYENCVINQLKVQAYAQLGDGANMAKAAEAVLGSGQVSGKEEGIYRQAAAQGYLQSGNTAKFAEYAKGDPEMQALLAQAYLKQGDYGQAVTTIKGAIAASGSAAPENWLLILYDAQRKSGDVTGSNATIESLLRTHPKPEYWKFVLTGMLNQKGMSDKQRLDVYRLMLVTNSLQSADDFTGMTEAALVSKSPGDAKRALDKGFAAGAFGTGAEADRPKRLLATATAKNNDDLKTLPGIEGQAAAQAGGDAQASIADSYLGNGQFARAISLYQSALAKGSLTDPVATKLHLGEAYAGQKLNEEARKTFSGISGKGFYRDIAGLWILTLH